MMDHSWFKLVLRLTGVLLLALYLPAALIYIARVIESVLRSDDFVFFNDGVVGGGVWMFVGFVPYFVVVLLGLYLTFDGRLFIKWCLRDIIGRCPTCGYDLRRSAEAICPECGSENPYRGKFAASKPSGASAASGNPASGG
ncbi:MAG: hypothetical protein IBJ18_08515 [Phycisphaerales bacterium]|nr:hypothetical protein [Phycisphaerales bacterium]